MDFGSTGAALLVSALVSIEMAVPAVQLAVGYSKENEE